MQAFELAELGWKVSRSSASQLLLLPPLVLRSWPEVGPRTRSQAYCDTSGVLRSILAYKADSLA